MAIEDSSGMFNPSHPTISHKVKFQELACFRIGGRGYAGNNYCENVRTPAR
jgi:hypothetical protein